MKIFKITCLFILVICTNPCVAQDTLRSLRLRIESGDKEALSEIAPYFDSTRKNIPSTNWEIREMSSLADIAKAIVRENSLFTPEEITINYATSSSYFLDFLSKNKDRILIDTLSNRFLITPLKDRNLVYQIYELSEDKKNESKKKAGIILQEHSKSLKEIANLIDKHNSECLLKIACALYQEGQKHLRLIADDDYISLIKNLTGRKFIFENWEGKLLYSSDENIDDEVKLNLLVFFIKNYKNFKWDSRQNIFVNTELISIVPDKEILLFEQIYSKDDKTALKAFIVLSKGDTGKVRKYSGEPISHGLDRNYALPVFPERFLSQMVYFTSYCRSHQIDFEGSQELKNKINQLANSTTNIKSHVELENKLLDFLTLENINAFEYWALIKEPDFSFTYSAGRILDIFYSRHWQELLANPKALDCYLKKSYLFQHIDIIGICNNYLVKFYNSKPETRQMLMDYKTNDSDIIIQISHILSNDIFEKKLHGSGIMYESDANRDYPKEDLKKISGIRNSRKDAAENYQDTICKILSGISYEQIGEAMGLIKNIKFKQAWNKYSFLERDWGFFIRYEFGLEYDFSAKKTRKKFLSLYNHLSEYDLYSWYLDKGGIAYKNADGTLDYDAIYEYLKFDISFAFVGGGGGKENNEVYSLIKLLELKFGTTLGFPKKLCNSNNLWYCSADDRATVWMKFLEDKNLLQRKHNEPVSFNFTE